MFRGFGVEDNAPSRAALVEGLAELAGVTTVGYAGDERTAIAWMTDPANDWDIAIIDLNLGHGARATVCWRQSTSDCHTSAWSSGRPLPALKRATVAARWAPIRFDRATEISQLMDFCMAHAEAQARSAGGSRFPPPPRQVLRAALFAN